MLDETDEVPKTVIVSTAKALSNILEDGYVDARSSYEFPGTPARGIALNNLRFAETVPDIETMINKKFYDHNIVLNLLIQYVRAREVNNLSGYSGEILDKFMSYIPLMRSYTEFQTSFPEASSPAQPPVRWQASAGSTRAELHPRQTTG